MACRLLAASALGYLVGTSLDLELALRSDLPVDGVLVCAMHAPEAFVGRADEGVTSLEEGGNQFEDGIVHVGDMTEDSVPFFATAAEFDVRPTEIGTIHDVLATDPRFAVRAQDEPGVGAPPGALPSSRRNHTPTKTCRLHSAPRALTTFS